jgi:hypothetical protein
MNKLDLRQRIAVPARYIGSFHRHQEIRKDARSARAKPGVTSTDVEMQPQLDHNQDHKQR